MGPAPYPTSSVHVLDIRRRPAGIEPAVRPVPRAVRAHRPSGGDGCGTVWRRLDAAVKPMDI